MKFLSTTTTTTYVLTTLALSMGANAYSGDDACSSVYRPVCCMPVAGTWAAMQTYPNEDCARVDGAILSTCIQGRCSEVGPKENSFFLRRGDEGCNANDDPVCCRDLASPNEWRTHPNDDCARVDGANLATCTEGPCNDEQNFLSVEDSEPTIDNLEFMESQASSRRGRSCSFPNRSTSSSDCRRREFCALDIGSCPTSRGTQRGTCLPIRSDVDYSYEPVCGCNDRTYPNLSAADAAGVNVRSFGRCRRGSFSSTSKSSKKRRSSTTTTSKSSKKRQSSSSTSKSSKARMEFAYE